RCVKGSKNHCSFPVSMLSAQQRCQVATALWIDHTRLESSCKRATLSCTALCIRSAIVSAAVRTLQVPHRVRRLPSYAPQRSARKVYGRRVCCMGESNDSTPQPQLDNRPDISLLADELQKQWHDKLNMHLGNVLIRPASRRKVWWSCAACPQGFPHIWEAAVLNRTYGRGCPFCSGNAVCQHNTLARKAPEVALFWDAKKNHPMSPDQVTVFSSMKAHWKCSACLHEWQASVMHKARGNTGCPKCAKANGGRKADGTRQKHPTFAKARHALLQQWDHDRNSKNGHLPDNTKLRSNKLIWWQCHECPKGKVHSWQAQAFSRTLPNKLTGCPYCAGHKLCECNSLETVCPDIAADFDVEQNGVTAAEVTSSARAKCTVVILEREEAEEGPCPLLEVQACAPVRWPVGWLAIRVCDLKDGNDSRGLKAKTYVMTGKVSHTRYSSSCGRC
ncbi:TPA: hypothetical protein ACH3X2_001340, partial [Trebouxia sp. C0005]